MIGRATRVVSPAEAAAVAQQVALSREDRLKAALEKSDPLAGVKSVADRERLTAAMEALAEGLASAIEEQARAQGKDFRPNEWRWVSPPWLGGHTKEFAKVSDEELTRILKHLVLSYEAAGYQDVGAEIRHARFHGPLERSHVEFGPSFRGAFPENVIRALD